MPHKTFPLHVPGGTAVIFESLSLVPMGATTIMWDPLLGDNH